MVSFRKEKYETMVLMTIGQDEEMVPFWLPIQI